MGLSVNVGVIADALRFDPEAADWYREDFETINRVLEEEGLPSHDEPKELPELVWRNDCSGFPYTFIHYLRRFYARAVEDFDWIPSPVAEGEDPTEDEVLNEESEKCESHLLCHSDCEGYYLPINFSDVIVSDKHEIPGGLLCSSFRLEEELIAIAPKLGIVLKDGVLSDSNANAINLECTEETTPFYIEKLVWITLFEAARLSIEHKSAIQFG